MVDNAGLLTAFGGGVISFLSPCVLPLVPVYLSLIGGVGVSDLRSGSGAVRFRVARETIWFVLGFTAVFVLLGLSVTVVGKALLHHQSTLTRIAGVAVVAMSGLLVATQLPGQRWAQIERRFHPTFTRFGPFASPVAGAAFGFGWTPCFGPVLASVVAVASTRATGRAASLLIAYSLGLGLPFLVTGLAFERVGGALGLARRHAVKVQVTAAVVLALLGLLLVFDRFTWLTVQLQALMEYVGLDRFVGLG